MILKKMRKAAMPLELTEAGLGNNTGAAMLVPRNGEAGQNYADH